MLKITLFGTPQITLDGQSLSDLITGRRLALFVYLVTSGRPHTRDVLADLLWSNTSNRKARKNLRDALPTLRRYLSDYLIIDADTVAFNRESYYWLDVEVFRSYVGTDLATCNPKMLREVLDLYQDDFLGGFYVSRAPVFEQWVLQEREELPKLTIQGLHVLANHYLAQDDYAAGLLITKRLLALEPWREEAHRLQMRLLIMSGQRSAALEQYAICQNVLQEEYGVEPLPETTLLYLEIKSGQFVAQSSAVNRSSTIDHAHYTADLQASINWNAVPNSVRLYGREEERAELSQWVEQDRCRLITLFGMAGQGKTALIAKLVHDWANSAMNGRGSSERFKCIVWYSLASQPTVAQVMHFFFERLLPPESPRPETLIEQFALLVESLRRQRCLLVLDHVEQIMPSGACQDQKDYDMYNELWRWVAQNEHQSCLILISRTPPQELSRLEHHNSAVRSLPLRGLSVEAGVTMLWESGLSADEKLLGSLVDSYSGHPLALTLIRETLLELSDDEIEFFFEDGLIFDELRDLLAFDRLSPAERDLLIWLAILEQPINVKSLWSQLVQPYPKMAYLLAQHSLRRQGLLGLLSCQLGSSRPQGAMALPKIVQAYVTEHVVETITQELVSYQTTCQALALEWLGNALSVSGATTMVDQQQMIFSMLQEVNPNDLEQWLMEQGSSLTYLNRYLLSFPLQQSILSRLVAKWGGDGCAKRLSELLFNLQMLRSEVGYAETNLRDLLLFFPEAKKNAQSTSFSPRIRRLIGATVLSGSSGIRAQTQHVGL